MLMRFIIKGKFVPYTRTTRKSQWSDRAKRYYASQNNIAYQVKEQMRDNGWEEIDGPISISVNITMSGRLHKQDFSNQFKAVEDALRGIVYRNDCWIDGFRESERKLGDEDIMIVEVRSGQENSL